LFSLGLKPAPPWTQHFCRRYVLSGGRNRKELVVSFITAQVSGIIAWRFPTQPQSLGDPIGQVCGTMVGSPFMPSMLPAGTSLTSIICRWRRSTATCLLRCPRSIRSGGMACTVGTASIGLGLLRLAIQSRIRWHKPGGAYLTSSEYCVVTAARKLI